MADGLRRQPTGPTARIYFAPPWQKADPRFRADDETAYNNGND
jgi:hypothetical protein